MDEGTIICLVIYIGVRRWTVWRSIRRICCVLFIIVVLVHSFLLDWWHYGYRGNSSYVCCTIADPAAPLPVVPQQSNRPFCLLTILLYCGNTAVIIKSVEKEEKNVKCLCSLWILSLILFITQSSKCHRTGVNLCISLSDYLECCRDADLVQLPIFLPKF